jgi:hypothetical protein
MTKKLTVDIPRNTYFVMYDPVRSVGRWGAQPRKRPYAVCYRRKTSLTTWGVSHHATLEAAMAAAKEYADLHGAFPPPDYVY